MTPIAMLCAWRGARMREGPLVGQSASHGICAECLEEFRREAATRAGGAEPAALVLGDQADAHGEAPGPQQGVPGALQYSCD